LWPNLAEQDPDILLSIGTGYNSNLTNARREPGPPWRPGFIGYAKRMLKLAVDMIQDDLNCQRIWEDFRRGLEIHAEDEERNQKYCRVNVDLGNELPKLDAVNEVERLEKITKDHFLQSAQLYQIAGILIASLFYFRTEKVEKCGSVWKCSGERTITPV
jgi:hypothetical protein